MWGRRPRLIFRWSSSRACPVRSNAPVRVSRETGSVCRLHSLQHAGDFLVSRSRPLEVGGRNSRGVVRLMRGPSRCTNTQDRRVDPCELCLRLSAREMRGRGELGQRASLWLRRDSHLSPWVIQGRFSASRGLPPCSARVAAWFGSHCCPVPLGLAGRHEGMRRYRNRPLGVNKLDAVDSLPPVGSLGVPVSFGCTLCRNRSSRSRPMRCGLGTRAGRFRCGAMKVVGAGRSHGRRGTSDACLRSAPDAAGNLLNRWIGVKPNGTYRAFDGRVDVLPKSGAPRSAIRAAALEVSGWCGCDVVADCWR